MKALNNEGLDHVVDKIYDLINSGGSADYIVEEGTSGSWYYRKWASGVAECWCRVTQTVTSWQTWGNVWEGKPYPGFTFPSGLFIEVPSVVANVSQESSSGGVMYEMGRVTQSGVEYLIPIRPVTTSSTVPYQYSVHARGLWKIFTPSMSDRVYKSFGSYTRVTGTMTTKAWANPDSTTTWTAPQDGLYIISMHIVTQNDTSYTSAYKMFRWFGTATALTDIAGLYFRGTTDGTQYGINGSTWSFPVLARQGQTVKSCIWTGAVFTCDVQICGILVGDYR